MQLQYQCVRGAGTRSYHYTGEKGARNVVSIIVSRWQAIIYIYFIYLLLLITLVYLLMLPLTHLGTYRCDPTAGEGC